MIGERTHNSVFTNAPQTYQPTGTHAEWWNSPCQKTLADYSKNPTRSMSDHFRKTCRMARREHIHGIIEAALMEDAFHIAHYQQGGCPPHRIPQVHFPQQDPELPITDQFANFFI